MDSTPLRLLIVEDSENDTELLLSELRKGGFEVTHRRVDTAEAMQQALETQEWDAVVSDFAMPHFSGIAALKLLRARSSEVPFIFTSGTIGEETAVAALKSGAQDYVMKSNLKRIVPSIQRELREAEKRREHQRLEQQLSQLQKFEAIGRLAGGIAHDFNNVIGAILGWAELGRQDAQEGTRVYQRFDRIYGQSQRAARLTSQLLAFARRQVLQRQKLNINSSVEEAIIFLQRVIGEHIEIRRATAADLWMTLADPGQMDQVLMNLCLNARDAMPNGGRLTIETSNAEIGQDYCRQYPYAKAGHYVLLSVSDTGTGMDAKTMENIFEPFFTTKEMGRGTGLGLATVYGIVKQHDGMINLDSAVGKGTTFRVYLPVLSGVAEAHCPDLNDSTGRKGTGTILLAEDHEGLREAAQEMLEELGFKLILAANGTEAVEAFKQNSSQIDIAILDIVMPGLGGPDAYVQMAAINPNLPVLFTTGYTKGIEAVLQIAQKHGAVIQKPYDSATLSGAIQSLLDKTLHDLRR
ncbi:MAG TPA: response regulator [Candidatus Saccharimonadales bacterium]|nr:response regulator [Candidatus Saccharimonadales bacterium]